MAVAGSSSTYDAGRGRVRGPARLPVPHPEPPPHPAPPAPRPRPPPSLPPAAHVVATAKGLAVLSVVKAGFLVTARGGSGVVLARLPDGSK